MANVVRLSSPIQKLCNCIFRRTFSCTSEVYRLKSEWRVDRKPANTKLSDEQHIVERRKAFGGRQKWKAISISEGMYSLVSQNIEHKYKIVDVVHSDAGKHYRENQIMAKGTYIVVDASPLKDSIDVQQLLIACDQPRDPPSTPEYVSSDPPSTPENVSNHVSDMLKSGKLYARVTSRPGQVGNCDGVIVEGVELSFLFDKLKMYDIKKDL